MLTSVRNYTEYHFNFNAHILIGKQKQLHSVSYCGNVKIKRKNGTNFLLLDAKEYFLKTKKITLPTKRTVTLKNIANRSVFVDIQVNKR